MSSAPEGLGEQTEVRSGQGHKTGLIGVQGDRDKERKQDHGRSWKQRKAVG